MENEEQPYNEVADQVGVHNALQQGTNIATQNRQMQYQMEDAEQNLAEAQLDVTETLLSIRHLLQQDVYKPNLKNNNILEWIPIEDNKKRVLTEEGVDKIMQVMQSYINKETLLSNFDEKMIMRRMLDFSLAFSGLIFMKYEVYFRTPTLNECKEILQNRINEKISKRRIATELQGLGFDEKATKKIIIDELMERFEYELNKIKEEKTKLNLREFEMIFTQLKALVESIHNRAWKGEERGSLRRHFNISEVIGGKPQATPKKSGWFGMGG